jgi:amidohydrolase
MSLSRFSLAASLLVAVAAVASGQRRPTTPTRIAPPDVNPESDLDRRTAAVLPKVVAWRRDFHQHPELSWQETRTAGIVAAHLRSLGLEVRTGVGRTGVVGVLRGGRPGPVVALRADMDALPVTEEGNLPFKSTVRATYNGQTTGVMHACGHDMHVAMLMGAAEVLAGMRAQVPGTVVFLFQPAEETGGEASGAASMIAAGALQNPAPSAIFGLHVFSSYPTNAIVTRPGGLMASSDIMNIVVRGRQTHGALPWDGVDPIVTASQIVMGLQTVVSRQVELTRSPAIVTVGSINGGIRFNIIPDSVVMAGTIRVFDAKQQDRIHERVTRTVQQIASSAGASATVSIERGNPVTYNDPALYEKMRPTLRRIAPAGRDSVGDQTTTAEDFSRYEQKIPGMFVFLGVTPPGTDPKQAAPNHSPRFFADEAALPTGVKLLSALALDYLVGAR